MLSINAVARLSRLTKPQIEQLVYRYGYTPSGSAPQKGKGREFTPSDAVRVAIIGELRSLQVSWEKIIEFGHGGPEDLINPNGERIHDWFSMGEKIGDDAVVVFHQSATGPSGISGTFNGMPLIDARVEIVTHEEASEWLASKDFTEAAIIVNLSNIITKVEEAVKLAEVAERAVRKR